MAPIPDPDSLYFLPTRHDLVNTPPELTYSLYIATVSRDTNVFPNTTSDVGSSGAVASTTDFPTKYTKTFILTPALTATLVVIGVIVVIIVIAWFIGVRKSHCKSDRCKKDIKRLARKRALQRALDLERRRRDAELEWQRLEQQRSREISSVSATDSGLATNEPTPALEQQHTHHLVTLAQAKGQRRAATIFLTPPTIQCQGEEQKQVENGGDISKPEAEKQEKLTGQLGSRSSK